MCPAEVSCGVPGLAELILVAVVVVPVLVVALAIVYGISNSEAFSYRVGVSS